MSLLVGNNLTKTYSGVTVLSDVPFELRPGEVHALVGENGAGKSTLCRILCGITPPTAGTMTLQGAAHAPRSRRQAETAGVRMVMQELNLMATLTVAENIYLDEMPRIGARALGVVDYRAMNAGAEQALADVGLRDVAPDRLVGSLGVGQAQLVEIAGALRRRCRVLVLDEPTAALTAPEIELLFARIARLKADGVGIIYVSHRMEEIRAVTDRLTVLRDGRWVGTRPTAEVTHDEIVKLMVGRDLTAAVKRDRSAAAPAGDIALSVKDLRLPPMVRGVSFDARRGEILGFAGLMGSGRTETMRAIFGADRGASGEIYLFGRRVRIRSPRQAVRLGIAMLTEDRKGQGLLLPMAIAANVTMPRMSAASRAGTWIDGGKELAVSGRFVDTLAIRCRSPRQAVSELSGGNQQKVVLAKWLLRDCDVLIFDEPTRGVDVGAKFEIYQLLSDLAARGKAIVVVSSDLLELMGIADRIAVMSAGRVARTFDRGGWTQERIMEAALSGYARTKVATDGR